MFTTRDLLDRERMIVEAAASARRQEVAALSRHDVDRTLARNAISLTDWQRFALLSLATSGHGVETVEALAGTGKTHLAGALRAVYADAGYAVVGVAPTGRAARELRERAGIEDASTLARLDLDGPGRLLERTVVIPRRGGDRFDAGGVGAGRPLAPSWSRSATPGNSPRSKQAGGWVRCAGASALGS